MLEEKKEYLNLFKPNFKYLNAKITNQFFIPYTWFTVVCKK